MDFSEIPEYEPEIYEPDFSVIRSYGKDRFNGHTMRRRNSGRSDNNPTIEIDKCDDGDKGDKGEQPDMIPVTTVDFAMGYVTSKMSKHEVSLSKRNRFNTIIDVVLEDASAIR